jgi:deazaflavin-dependent oxidoreductase (nitroreductase family)
MEVKETLTDVQMKTMNALHKTLLTVSGGRYGNTVGSMPVVKLHTVGRKSGKKRVTMLTSPINEDGNYILVASKGGDNRDPDWYRNVVANPDIQLEISDETLDFTARVLTPEEKLEVWPRITEAYKGYAGYQKKTDREIPVIICEPRKD